MYINNKVAAAAAAAAAAATAAATSTYAAAGSGSIEACSSLANSWGEKRHPHTSDCQDRRKGVQHEKECATRLCGA